MVLLVSFTAIANKKKLPYPVLLVFGGLVIGFIPHLPELVVDPEIIFVIILPPLLYDAASKTSWHEFRTSIRPIAALAITLVFFTTVSVAVAAYYLIPGFSWPLAFVLGAIVSPPDAVAATGIIKGLGLNKKVITIIEGESLMNDASALIAYRYAVAAVTTGTFVFWKAGMQFLMVAGGGIISGILLGYLFAWVHKKIVNNAVVETSFTLLSPFISYLAAEQFHLSGLLAVVCTGLVMAWRAPEVFSYQTRMRTRAVWETLIFLLHGFVFILIGLQFPLILKDLGNSSALKILGYGLLISLITIIVRIIWVFSTVYLQKIFQRNTENINEPGSDIWKNVSIVAWTGTRGIISLATALALPLLLAGGAPFPKRYTIIFIAFVVVFTTLVVQGLSLPILISRLKIKPQDNTIAEENELKLHLVESTLHFIENELPGADNNLKKSLKLKYETQVKEFTKEVRRHKTAMRKDIEIQPAPTADIITIELEINKFKRNILLQLHKDGEYTGTVIKKAEREMDIDEMKLNLLVTKE
jgi:monovalent cation/hydrogen antiporter